MFMKRVAHTVDDLWARWGLVRAHVRVLRLIHGWGGTVMLNKHKKLYEPLANLISKNSTSWWFQTQGSDTGQCRPSDWRQRRSGGFKTWEGVFAEALSPQWIAQCADLRGWRGTRETFVRYWLGRARLIREEAPTELRVPGAYAPSSKGEADVAKIVAKGLFRNVWGTYGAV